MSISARYTDLSDALSRLAAGIGASELHGSLTGYVLAGDHPPPSGWMGRLELESLDEALTDQAERAVFDRMYTDLFATLDSPELEFALLLPDDEASIDERARALVDWCRGFLGGLGLSGMQPADALSSDATEVLKDLARIASTRFDEVDNDEEGENAYAEVVEYVRIGVMLLHSELARAADRATRH